MGRVSSADLSGLVDKVKDLKDAIDRLDAALGLRGDDDFEDLKVSFAVLETGIDRLSEVVMQRDQQDTSDGNGNGKGGKGGK